MANSINVKELLPSGTMFYLGRRLLRHREEPGERDMHQEERLQVLPESYPHVFWDFSGQTIQTILEDAASWQMLKRQRVMKDKFTPAEIATYRRGFTEEMLKGVVTKVINPKDVSEEDLADLTQNGHYVVINHSKAGTKPDVPKQPVDKLNAIKENAKAIYDALLANLEGEEQLEEAVRIYDQVEAMDL